MNDFIARAASIALCLISGVSSMSFAAQTEESVAPDAALDEAVAASGFARAIWPPPDFINEFRAKDSPFVKSAIDKAKEWITTIVLNSELPTNLGEKLIAMENVPSGELLNGHPLLVDSIIAAWNTTSARYEVYVFRGETLFRVTRAKPSQVKFGDARWAEKSARQYFALPVHSFSERYISIDRGSGLLRGEVIFAGIASLADRELRDLGGTLDWWQRFRFVSNRNVELFAFPQLLGHKYIRMESDPSNRKLF